MPGALRACRLGNKRGRRSIGSSIGNLAKALIPRLATGTVVPPNREFMTVLGDNKREPEIVFPISSMGQAMENVLRKNGNIGGGKEVTIHIPFSVDGQVFFDLMKKYGLQQCNRTGQPSFQI